jgi:hypothetical protein
VRVCSWEALAVELVAAAWEVRIVNAKLLWTSDWQRADDPGRLDERDQMYTLPAPTLDGAQLVH